MKTTPMYKIPRQHGFTIVETLVAITILMISIAGPLSIASKGLTAALAARDQMVAAYLAQESMEVVKNIRDNNIAKNEGPGSYWLDTGASPASFVGCTLGSPCDVSVIDIQPIVNSDATGNPPRYLLRLSTDGYGHTSSGGTASLFSRATYLTNVGTVSDPCNSSTQCTVTVVVNWNEGTVPYEVKVSSIVINTDR